MFHSVLPDLIPLILIGCSLAILIPSIINRYRFSGKIIELSDQDYTGLQNDDEKPSLHRVEDRILFSSVHAAVEESVQSGALDQREKIPSERFGDWVGYIGSLGFVVVQVLYMLCTHDRHGWGKLTLFVSHSSSPLLRTS